MGSPRVTRLHHNLRRLFLLAVGAAGSLIVLVATSRYGIGLSPDAVGYVRVARELNAGHGIPSYFVLQPPLYPILLAGAGFLTGTDPAVAATGVQIVLYGIIIALSGWVLFSQFPENPLLAAMGTLAVLAARPLFTSSILALSEALFVVWVLAALASLQAYLRSGSRAAFIIALAAAALAPLTRYIGVAVVLTGVAVLLLDARRPLRTRVLFALLFGTVATLPLALWGIRNYLVAGTLAGARGLTRFPPGETLRAAWNTLATWILPEPWRDLGLGALVAVAIAGAVLYFVLRSRSPAVVPQPRPALAPYALFTVIFLALLIGSSLWIAYNRINSRLMAPVFVPLLITLLVGLEQLLAILRTRISPMPVNVGAALILALGLVYPFQFQLQRTAGAAEGGAGGYVTARWLNSPTIRYVREHLAELGPTIYTNAPDALYYLANLDAPSVPPEFAYNSVERVADVQDLRGSWPPKPAVLVWFPESQSDDFLFSLAELGEIADLSPVAEFEDGAVYRVAPVK